MNFDHVLLSYRDYYGAYHHHKEQMVYAATVLYLSLASALILSGPDVFKPVGPTVLEVKFLLASVLLGFLFVGWQLRKREIAADIVAACTTLVAENRVQVLL